MGYNAGKGPIEAQKDAMICTGVIVTFLLALVGAVTPYNDCPQQQRRWYLQRRADSAPGSLTAEDVYQDDDGGWHARYHLIIDDIDNVGPDTVAEVKLLSPYSTIYYSENIPGDYNDENWFDWEFIIDFEPTDDSDCSKIVIPRVMIQYDYKAGGYNSDDYSTGCNSDDNGPEYAFSTCPNPHTDTVNPHTDTVPVPTGAPSTLPTTSFDSTITLTGVTSHEQSQTISTSTFATGTSHSQFINSISTEGFSSATTDVVTDPGTTYQSTETKTPGTETFTSFEPGSTYKTTEVQPDSTIVHSSIVSGSTYLSTETQPESTKTHSVTESGTSIFLLQLCPIRQ